MKVNISPKYLQLLLLICVITSSCFCADLKIDNTGDKLWKKYETAESSAEKKEILRKLYLSKSVKLLVKALNNNDGDIRSEVKSYLKKLGKLSVEHLIEVLTRISQMKILFLSSNILEAA